jgi:putative phage-type endonuclease
MEEPLLTTSAVSSTETQLEEDLCVFLFYEYYKTNIADLHHSWYDDEMFDNVKELVSLTLEQTIDEGILSRAYDIFRCMYPCRTSLLPTLSRGNFEATLELLRGQPKHEQRTPAWYETRHNLITASSAYKMFGTSSEQNSLIVEKCAPEKERPALSLYDARHWGVRYEPVSTMYYTQTRSTVVEEFGCLVHPSLAFLGASPDGINVKPDVEVYGRMLEIKNPVSRVITGVPTTEYWIQMQLQMEVCGIESCDFLETRFVEYDTYEAFAADGSFEQAADGKPKGLILLFSKEGKFMYSYAPYGVVEDLVAEWEADEKKDETREFIKTIYWRLEEVSCVLVERNQEWFAKHVEQMAQFWATISSERESGNWTTRLPVKKTPTW